LSIGCAPPTKRPLTKVAGVPLTPSIAAIFLSASTRLPARPASRQRSNATVDRVSSSA